MYAQSSEFRVQSSKFKVQSSKFKVQSSKFKVQSSKFKVQSSKLFTNFRALQMSNKRKLPISPNGDVEEGSSPSMAIRIDDQDHNEHVENCVVCMDVCDTNKPCCTLPCLHTFHSVCIHPWLMDNTTCPICRVQTTTCNRGPLDQHPHQVVATMLRIVCCSNSTMKSDLQEANDHILSLEMLLSDVGRIEVFMIRDQ
jgi:hypothetical protein